MSKYNLIDIFEQYQIGSGFTRDFDYAGMLNAGLKTGVDTDIEILRKMSDDFEDVNYHRENNHLQKAIDALEEGAIKEASMFFGDFHAEIKSTMETFDMDISDDLGAFMASKMEENTEAVDLAIEASQEKAGMEVDESFKSLAKKLDKQKGITKKEADKIAGSIAAKKRAGAGKGPTAKQKKRMTEVRIDRDVAERIEGFLNIPMKAKFLNAFEDLIYDLLDDEPFYVDDVIAHLSNEMHKRINGNQVAGERLAGIGESSDEYVDEIGEGAMQPGEADLEAGVKGNMDAFTEEDSVEEGYVETKGKALYPILKAGANATGDEVEMYVKSLAKDIELNGKEQYKDFKSEDFVEDFKEYIANKSLQEHFKRFI